MQIPKTDNTYVSPVVVLDFSLLSTFFVDITPGTGSSVSRRRTPELGKRTVWERILSTTFVRFVTELGVTIDDAGGPPLAFAINDE